MTTTTTTTANAAATWALLKAALTNQRRVHIHYQEHDRVICPHILGWKNNEPRVLAYQLAGTTSQGPVPNDPTRRWRSMNIADIDHATIIDGDRQTAPNYTAATNTIDTTAAHH